MDIIQKRLGLIDFKLAFGPSYLFKQITHKAPLVIPALGLIIGIIFQNFLALSISLWLVLSAIFVIIALVAIYGLAILKKSAISVYTIAFTVFVCAVALGAIRLTSSRILAPNDISNLVSDQRTLATIRGIVLTQPYTNDNKDWAFAKFKFNDPVSSFYLKVTDAQTTTGWKNVSGVVYVYVNETLKDLNPGDCLQLYCWLERLNTRHSPGQFDFTDLLAKKNIFISASVETRRAIEILENKGADFFFNLKRYVSSIAAQSLLGSTFPQDESESLLQALVLGLRADIDSATYRAFRQTGLLHFVCLSGMNFIILIAFVWWLCKLTGFGKKRQAIICIVVSILFVLAVPPNPPVLRAAVISIVFCASFLFRRQPNSFNSLALSAIILLLFKPADLYNAGWQLSFSTTLGILLFCRRIQFYIYEKIFTFPIQIFKEQKFALIINENSLFNLSGLISTGISAWLGGAGLMLYHFYTITPLTSIWTILASPLIAIISLLGYLKLFIGLILPTTASALNLIIKPLSGLLIWLVKLFAKVSLSEILIGNTPISFIILYYCCLFFIAFFFFRRPLLRKIIIIILISTFTVSLLAIKIQRTYTRNLVLTCFDVGHGQSILAQLPRNTNILFDAGSLTNNVGRRVIIPALNYFGVKKLSAIAISHNDIDHINAVPEIAIDAKPPAVFVNQAFLNDSNSNNPAGFLKDFLTRRSFSILPMDSLNIKSQALLKILWPTQSTLNPNLSINDLSFVFQLDFAGRKILLCSDIEKSAQGEILKLYPGLKADIVVVPHHGSTATLDKGFLKSLDADFLICSNNLDRLNIERNSFLSKGKIFCTADSGTIQVVIHPDGRIEIIEF
jgi:competence protein ComEC